MEFNNIFLYNIKTPINITFSTPSQIFLNSTEKHSNDSHLSKTDHLRQKITEEVTTKCSNIPKTSPDHTKLYLMKSHIA